MLSTAAAHGALGRSLTYLNCNVAPILKGVAEVNPTVNLLVGLLNPPNEAACKAAGILKAQSRRRERCASTRRSPAGGLFSGLDSQRVRPGAGRSARSARAPAARGEAAEMQKRAPTLGNLLVIILFTLSCFGLLLFLWESFGGPLPLKPKGYRFTVAFPRTLALAEQSDVRISGVDVGHVVSLKLGKRRPHRTRRSNSAASTRRSARTRTRSCARRRCWGRPTCS